MIAIRQSGRLSRPDDMVVTFMLPEGANMAEDSVGSQRSILPYKVAGSREGR